MTAGKKKQNFKKTNKEKDPIKDILEIVTFIRDNAATQDQITELKTEIKDVRTELKKEIRGVREELKFDIADVRRELKETREEMIGHIDQFIGLHQKLDTELTALRSKYERLEKTLQQVIKHLQLEIS